MLSLCALLVCSSALSAGDQPQWGEEHSRNMVSPERNLPIDFDPATGKGVRWSVDLGDEAYATPVVSQGRVFVGTNNDVPMDPRHQGTHGVMLCLDERDGSLVWQLVVPRRLLPDGTKDPFIDQPRISLCSSPSVEGDRVYVVTNRDEVVCLDLYGMANGNDGPYRDEGQHLVQPGEAAKAVTPLDADILWVYDLVAELDVHPHDSPHASILIDGRYLYVNTSNGLDSRHSGIPKPDAPSLIVLDKLTGRLVAQDNEHIGPRIFHCTWSSPAKGTIDGRDLIIFCGGDGVVYAFDPVPQDYARGDVLHLNRVWRFDCDPTAPKEDIHKYVGNKAESPSNIMGMPVFHQDRVYVCGGGDFWWGKNEAFVKCIDATGQGDITESGQIWSQPLLKHSCATPAIADGMVFVSDLGRHMHCFSADTGELYWKHDMGGALWSTILVADGKVYVGSDRNELCILKADRQLEVLNTIRLDSRIRTTPVAANGSLYFNTLRRMYAIGK